MKFRKIKPCRVNYILALHEARSDGEVWGHTPRCLQDFTKNAPCDNWGTDYSVFQEKALYTFSPVQSYFKVVVLELLYCPGWAVSARAEQVSRNKAACTTNSLIPHFFSHLTTVTIPIKDFRFPHIIEYAFYTIKYPIDSIKLTQWIEITNVTGIWLPAQHIPSFPQTPEAGCDPSEPNHTHFPGSSETANFDF